jgi:hypothetical protein
MSPLNRFVGDSAALRIGPLSTKVRDSARQGAGEGCRKLPDPPDAAVKIQNKR